MSPAFPTRRRADEFDRLVESTLSGNTAAGPASAELAALASFATALREAPAVTPRADFAADLRERLMTAAATELTAAAADRPVDRLTDRLTVGSGPAARRRGERRLTLGIASLAIVGASAGTALASQGALPGEPLYPVKRAIENVRTGFSPSDSAKGASLLGEADTRLDEVAELSRSSAGDQDEIATTLNAFAEQAKKASDLLLTTYQQDHDPAAIEKLHEFTANSIDQLTVLEPLLPDAAKQALASAAQAILMIDTAAHNLCPACGGDGVTSLPETLLDPMSQTLDSMGKSLADKLPSAAHSDQPIALPSVPVQLGPAVVDPTSKATVRPVPKTSITLAPSKTKGILSAPTATPSTLGGAVGDVTGTVSGTVDGVVGLVGGLLGGTTPTP